MIKFNELKPGDIVMAEYDGKLHEGEVLQLNGDEKQVCVHIMEVQDFWFETSQLHPIMLDEAQLFKLGFQKQVNDDGTVKYLKGAFRMLVPQSAGFTNFEMWYREDHRVITHPISVHEFQNKYHDMTKVHLVKGELPV